MTITSILGNTFDGFLTAQQIDYLSLEWYECTKRILHKTYKVLQKTLLLFVKPGCCVLVQQVKKTLSTKVERVFARQDINALRTEVHDERL